MNKIDAAAALRRFGTTAAMVIGALAAALPSLAQAQFATVPAPQCKPPPDSQAQAEREYRAEASRHLYACYPMRIYRGKLPPLLYSVMIVEVELDAKGGVVNVTTVRKPAADGRIARHRDYWDAAGELYEKLPLLGTLMRWLRRRIAAA